MAVSSRATGHGTSQENIDSGESIVRSVLERPQEHIGDGRRERTRTKNPVRAGADGTNRPEVNGAEWNRGQRNGSKSAKALPRTSAPAN